MANTVKPGKLTLENADFAAGAGGAIGKQPAVKDGASIWTQFGVIAPLLTPEERAGRPRGDNFGAASILAGNIVGKKSKDGNSSVFMWCLGREIQLPRDAFTTIEPVAYDAATDGYRPPPPPAPLPPAEGDAAAVPGPPAEKPPAWGNTGAIKMEEEKVAAIADADFGDTEAELVPGEKKTVGKGAKKYTWALLTPEQEVGVKLKPWADASKVKAGLLDAKSPEEWRRLYFDTYLNANVPAEVKRMNDAMDLFSEDREARFTEDEYRQCRLVLLAGPLHPSSGVEGLFSDAKRGLAEPPNFGKYVHKTRFRAFLKWCIFAHADEEEVLEAVYQPGGLDVRTFEMTRYRREYLHARKLTEDLPQRIVFDEERMRWVPRTTPNGACPQLSYENRKPDKIACEQKNAADPDQHIQVASDPVDTVDRQRLKKWGDKYGTTVATSLRLLESSGATKTNSGNAFGDAWFPSMELVEAMEIEFPGWSITGPMKNNTAGFPLQSLKAHAKSIPGRIRKGGFNAFMVTTSRSGVTQVMAVAHKYNQRDTVIFITTAGDCGMGKDYEHNFTDIHGDRVKGGVARPEVCCRFFATASIIDDRNSYTGHDLDLTSSWPVGSATSGWAFWRKSYIHWDGIHFVDMYLHLRANGKLESMHTGRVESILEFLDRFLGVVLKPAIDHQVTTPEAVVHSPRRNTVQPRTAMRGVKRKSIALDGQHEPGVDPEAPVRIFTEASGREKQKRRSRPCKVCEHNGGK